jgi:anti-sigma factor RsiW
MKGHESALIAFLAGDLDPDAAAQFEAHLIDCEPCWRALREDRLGSAAAEALRSPAPPGLTDRVRFAVEVAAISQPRRGKARLAGAGGSSQQP